MESVSVRLNGDFIKRLRKDNGFKSQQDLANALESPCDRKTISHAETNKAISSGIAHDIAKALKVSYRSLLHRDEVQLDYGDSRRSAASNVYQFNDVIQERARGFVEREWLDTLLENHLQSVSTGSDSDVGTYFMLVGEPGAGKTSWLAAAVRRYAWHYHHFNDASVGMNTATHFLNNMTIRLEMDTAIDHAMLNSVSVDMLLRSIKNSVPPIVIAIDALDEVVVSGFSSNENPLQLPNRLPPGIKVVCTSRPNTAGTFFPERMTRIDLNAQHDECEKDIRNYLMTVVNDTDIANWREQSGNMSRDEFTELMLEKSELNYMYLHYVLRDLSNFNYKAKQLEPLPVGLQNYYQSHWKRMKSFNANFSEIHAPVLASLVAMDRPLSLKELAAVAGISIHAAQQVVDDWRDFLAIIFKQTGQTDEPATGANSVITERMYKIYHESFRDFFKEHQQAAINDAIESRISMIEKRCN